MSEPIKHHFIPQFILRNFVEDKQLNYWNMKTNVFEKRNPKSVFMRKNLYKDIKNHPNEIMAIEKKFALLERDIAQLISNKILNKNEIQITRTENELLRRFLFLLGYRSENRKRQYREQLFDPITIQSLKPLVKDDDYIDLWLRELDAILELDSFEGLEINNRISIPIKMDLENELSGYYMSFVDSRGQDFLLSDIYPTTEIFPIDIATNTKIDLHSFFPLSPNRALILSHVMFRKDRRTKEPAINNMINFSNVNPNINEAPRVKYSRKGMHSRDDQYIYTVRKIYSDDVKYINSLYLNECKDGFIFNEICRVRDSVIAYNKNEVEKRKNDYLEFLKVIDNRNTISYN